ncbi:hypothetical protein HDR59_01215 [bacterium]|nr:hypothetical protein [bacterium]
MMNNNLKKNYNVYISIIISLISLCLSSVNFKVNQPASEIHSNVIGLYKFYFLSMLSVLGLFKIFSHKNFFDKYLLSATIFAISIFLPAFTSFSYTNLYEYSVVFILALILWNLYNTIKNNIKVYPKITYLIFLLLYCACIYIILIFWGLSRCVGGCL